MNVTVFTAVLGDTDPLLPPTVVGRGVRYVCFTDRPLHVPPYVMVPVDVGPEGPCYTSRQLKILADHPALGTPDVVLWHDAAFQLTSNPLSVIARELAGADLVAFRHPHRDRIEDEAVVIAQFGYVALEHALAQVATYRAAGWVDQSAITSTGFSLRRVTPAVRAFNARWWDEVARWCVRDQMSVDYALWSSGLAVTYLPGHYRDNAYATWRLWRNGRYVTRRSASPRVFPPVVAMKKAALDTLRAQERRY